MNVNVFRLPIHVLKSKVLFFERESFDKNSVGSCVKRRYFPQVFEVPTNVMFTLFPA